MLKSFILLFVFVSSLANAAGSDSEGIRKIIQEKAHLQDVRHCYEEALKDDPKLEGKIVVAWDVNDKGETARERIDENKSALKSARVKDCVIGKLKSWKFPPAPKGQTVEIVFPFVFRP